MNKIADIPLGPLRGFNILGLQDVDDPTIVGSIEVLTRVLSMIVGFLSIIASVYFLFKIITAGLAIITASGDKGKVAEARTSITNGLIGLLVVLLSTVIVGFIGILIGIDFLNLAGLTNLLSAARNN
jgi:hypothetical protein